MGVSESSLKRWCDRGALATQRTAGGHRKIPVSSVVQFLRENRRELVRPEVIGLPTGVQTAAESLSAAVGTLAEQLVAGEAETCRRIAFGVYLGGHSLAKMGDELFRPALSSLGTQWQTGDLEIYEEHRAVEIIVGLLHELRFTLAAPLDSAPFALGGALAGDTYGLPTQMVELSLLDAGWRATSLGTSLPFCTLQNAIEKHRPQLFWLSISQMPGHSQAVAELNAFSEAASRLTPVFLGGRGLTPELRQQLRFSTQCDNIQQLVSYGQLLANNHAAQIS